jgi:hypothetical protein
VRIAEARLAKSAFQPRRKSVCVGPSANFAHRINGFKEHGGGGRKSCPPSGAHKVHSVLSRYKVVNTISKELPRGELRNAPFMYILKHGSLKGILTVKISEHPTQKVHKLHLRREAAYDEDTGRAAESVETRSILSVNPTSPNDPQLGTLLLEEGLISDSQRQEALRTQSELNVYKPLGQILVDQKAVLAKQLNLFIDKHHKRARLGEILRKSKIITGEQLEIALSYQKTTGLPLGEMLLTFPLDDPSWYSCGFRGEVP